MNILSTTTTPNANISAYLEVGSYTADANRVVMIRLLLDQIVGSGDYSAYITIQSAGVGSAYSIGPITTYAVGAVTAAGFVAGVQVPLETGDVLKVYVKGLAGDIATPDVRCKIVELGYSAAGAQMDIIDAPNATGVGVFSAANWNYTSSALTVVGSIGKAIADFLAALTTTRAAKLDNLDAAVSTRSTLTQANILSDATPFHGSYIDVPISTRVPSGVMTVKTVSPVNASGNIDLVQGCDYKNTDGMACIWESTLWADLTLGSITTVIDNEFSGAGVIEISGGTGVTQRIYQEFTAAQTATMEEGKHPFRVLGTLVSGDIVPLVKGTVTIERIYTS